MITTKPKPDAIQGIYKLIRAAYSNCWDEVVAEQEPLLNQIMTMEGHSDPMKAIIPLVRDMERRGQDPSLIIAVAYEIKSKTKSRGWTL
jgi:hypothetical protein